MRGNRWRVLHLHLGRPRVSGELRHPALVWPAFAAALASAAGKFRQRKPKRQRTRARPAPDVVTLQKRAVGPGEGAGRANGCRALCDELAARQRWPNTVKDPGQTALCGE